MSSARRPLLAYGAAVLEEIIRQSSPKEIVVSVLGVREGLIYSHLTPTEQDQDPLILTAREFNQLLFVVNIRQRGGDALIRQ